MRRTWKSIVRAVVFGDGLGSPSYGLLFLATDLEVHRTGCCFWRRTWKSIVRAVVSGDGLGSPSYGLLFLATDLEVHRTGCCFWRRTWKVHRTGAKTSYGGHGTWAFTGPQFNRTSARKRCRLLPVAIDCAPCFASLVRDWMEPLNGAFYRRH